MDANRKEVLVIKNAIPTVEILRLQNILINKQLSKRTQASLNNNRPLNNSSKSDDFYPNNMSKVDKAIMTLSFGDAFKVVYAKLELSPFGIFFKLFKPFFKLLYVIGKKLKIL